MNSSRHFFKSAFNSAKSSSSGQRAFFTHQRRAAAAFSFNLSSAQRTLYHYNLYKFSLTNYLTLSIYSLRSMSTSHSMALVSANTRLALMNMSLSDSLMQLLMNELAVEETDEETL